MHVTGTCMHWISEKNGALQDQESNDCVVSTCCSPCALCQESRELEARRQTSKSSMLSIDH